MCTLTRFQIPKIPTPILAHSKKLIYRSMCNTQPRDPLRIADLQREENRKWYFENKDYMYLNYWRKWVLVDQEKVVTLFNEDQLFKAQQYQGSNPSCFLTFVGDEDWYKSILSRTSRDKGHHILLSNEDIVPKLIDLPQTEERFRSDMTNRFIFHSKRVRPWLRLGIKSSILSSVIFPVWFLVDTGVPFTYLEENTAKTIFGSVPTATNFTINIVGRKKPVISSLSFGVCENINLLGTDVIWSGRLVIDHPKELFLTFTKEE